MKLIIAGSREVSVTSKMIDAAIAESFPTKPTEIVSGLAKGPDRAGKRWAEENGVNLALFPANWKGEGRAAGHLRNYRMAKYGDALLAFWDGKSRGTKGMLDEMRKLHKTVAVYRV